MKNFKILAGLFAIFFVFICACCQFSKAPHTETIPTTDYNKSGTTIALPKMTPTSEPTRKVIRRTPTATKIKQTNTPSVTPTRNIVPMVTAKDTNVNLRSGPGTNYNVVGSLKEGESLKAIGRNSDSSWWQVSDGGNLAWVFAGVVTITNVDGEIAIVEAPPPPATPLPTPTIASTSTPIPVRLATIQPLSPNTTSSSCCKHCGPNSKACGDSCISRNKTCRKGPGCACN